jgi:hypothetical protein
MSQAAWETPFHLMQSLLHADASSGVAQPGSSSYADRKQVEFIELQANAAFQATGTILEPIDDAAFMVSEDQHVYFPQTQTPTHSR